jgi:membrane-bound ClpP family serine protease
LKATGSSSRLVKEEPVDIYMLLLAVFLYIVSAALIVAEVFLPSAGIITICSILCLAGGISIFFAQGGPAMGIFGIVIGIVMFPVVFIASYRILPKTRFGKSVTLAPPERQQGGGIPDAERLRKLMGVTATVVTPLRPVGMCDFSGEKIECVAESGYVEKGKTVQVIAITGTQLTVRVI